MMDTQEEHGQSVRLSLAAQTHLAGLRCRAAHESVHPRRVGQTHLNGSDPLETDSRIFEQEETEETEVFWFFDTSCG
jgi:hypothetical protein